MPHYRVTRIYTSSYAWHVELEADTEVDALDMVQTNPPRWHEMDSDEDGDEDWQVKKIAD
jgi:hypothetical protein